MYILEYNLKTHLTFVDYLKAFDHTGFFLRHRSKFLIVLQTKNVLKNTATKTEFLNHKYPPGE